MSESEVAEATHSLMHRGPDDFGYYGSPKGFAMGFRRLSIIDLRTGHQPVGNEDGTVLAILNGEIYNYREVRARLESLGHIFKTTGDTEVLVHGYEQWGCNLPAKLCGMFALAVWDESQGQLLLARDRLGIKPLYYVQGDRQFGYASEPASLFCGTGLKPEVDAEALGLYLQYFYVPAPWSIFRGVKKLEPAHAMLVSPNGFKIWSYWDVHFEPSHRTLHRTVEDFGALMEGVVGQHMIADVPLGAFLSGGMDSSTVVTVMAGVSREPVLTFNIGFDQAAVDESAAAAHVAQRLGTRHFRLNCSEFLGNPREVIGQWNEPFGDSSAVPTYLVSKLARGLCTVALSGDGGDEVFGGYIMRRARLSSRLLALPGILRRGARWASKVGKLFPGAEMDPVDWYESYHTRIPRETAEWLLPDGNSAASAHGEHLSRIRATMEKNGVKGHLNPLLYLDLKFNLPDDMLTKVDIASMAHSLEVRVPLLDHRIVEFAAGLPESHKQSGYGPDHTKILLRNFLLHHFDRSFVNRRKYTFGLPLPQLLSGPLRTEISETVLDPAFLSWPMLDGRHTESAVRKWLGESGASSADRLWGFYCLAVWRKQVLGPLINTAGSHQHADN